MNDPVPLVLEREYMQQLLDALGSYGFKVIGPVIRDGAIVLDELPSVEQLPIGWTDVQEPGKYRLKPRTDQALFGYNTGPQNWKKYLYPAVMRLWEANLNNGSFRVTMPLSDPPRLAFFGVRACELTAISILDRVFTQGAYVDASYQRVREQVFVVAVNCGQANGTCFCASVNSGPRAASGYDLALTEVIEAERHYFVVDVGSPKGEQVLQRLPIRAASADEVQAAADRIDNARQHMGRTVDLTHARELLYANTEHPYWDDITRRCMACGNCTMVCPTCFCTTVEDVTDLSGEHAYRVRKWDSCFTGDFSYIHGLRVRDSAKARYRQRVMHKLASWVDQFGGIGCVGCGRCITWCPVGIDLTEEVSAISETAQATSSRRNKRAPVSAGD
jgi:ferredoxin